MSDIADADAWLIVKRDLYFLPNCRGYTGIRDKAGRYPYEVAKNYENRFETTIIRLLDAPEFSLGIFPDLLVKHLTEQRDKLRSELDQARGMVERLTAECEHWKDLVSRADLALNPWPPITSTNAPPKAQYLKGWMDEQYEAGATPPVPSPNGQRGQP